MKRTQKITKTTHDYEEVSTPKKQLKARARDRLLFGLVASMSLADDAEVQKEMQREVKRVEKLFGYEPGSFKRAA